MTDPNEPQAATGDQGPKRSEASDKSVLHVDRGALAGGAIAAIVALLGMIVINVSSGSEARFLLEAMLPSVRFLCSAVTTASATILALMLTMLGFSRERDAKLKSAHYERVRQIALVDTITFIAAIILLLILSIPLAESQDVPQNWYTIVYYVTVVYAAALGGALISIVLLLYNAIVDLIRVIHPNEHSELVVREQ